MIQELLMYLPLRLMILINSDVFMLPGHMAAGGGYLLHNGFPHNPSNMRVSLPTGTYLPFELKEINQCS